LFSENGFGNFLQKGKQRRSELSLPRVKIKLWQGRPEAVKEYLLWHWPGQQRSFGESNCKEAVSVRKV
jgi:hypothetical protein